MFKIIRDGKLSGTHRGVDSGFVCLELSACLAYGFLYMSRCFEGKCFKFTFNASDYDLLLKDKVTGEFVRCH